MLGVTANNDNDVSGNRNQEEQLEEELQKESLTPLPFFLMILTTFQKLSRWIGIK